MINILHITPHLGGGVGKAVSGLIRQSMLTNGHHHSVYALEWPEKTQFTEELAATGCQVRQAPTAEELHAAIAAADIVQIEFWNHPAIVRALCAHPLPAMRLMVWCHVSGLYQPAIPWGLVQQAEAFLFTSPSSLELLQRHGPTPQVHVVSSGGGMDEMPQPPRKSIDSLHAGYLGSLNFSKLHPNFVRFLATVDLPDFSVRMIGDEINRPVLEAQCRALGRPHLLEFLGYRNDVARELAQLDVLIYLLNPCHYGTAENTLLEAMAMGVVPIVLDNPSESHIVEHDRTGLIVRTPEDLAREMAWLASSPADRSRLAEAAATMVRGHYTYSRMAAAFDQHYREIIVRKKRSHAFRDIFGPTPADWFLAFQPENSYFSLDGEAVLPPAGEQPSLYERTKGSVFHFLDYFPGDPRLSSWGEKLRKYGHDFPH